MAAAIIFFLFMLTFAIALRKIGDALERRMPSNDDWEKIKSKKPY